MIVWCRSCFMWLPLIADGGHINCRQSTWGSLSWTRRSSRLSVADSALHLSFLLPRRSRRLRWTRTRTMNAPWVSHLMRTMRIERSRRRRRQARERRMSGERRHGERERIRKKLAQVDYFSPSDMSYTDVSMAGMLCPWGQRDKSKIFGVCLVASGLGPTSALVFPGLINHLTPTNAIWAWYSYKTSCAKPG